MGEIVELDSVQLCTVADRVLDAAAAIAQIRCAAVHVDEIPGSAVSRIDLSTAPAARLSGIAGDLRSWAESARRSATAFDRVDARTGERLSGR